MATLVFFWLWTQEWLLVMLGGLYGILGIELGSVEGKANSLQPQLLAGLGGLCGVLVSERGSARPKGCILPTALSALVL